MRAFAGCKAPVSFDIVSVAVKKPGSNLALEVRRSGIADRDIDWTG